MRQKHALDEPPLMHLLCDIGFLALGKLRRNSFTIIGRVINKIAMGAYRRKSLILQPNFKSKTLSFYHDFIMEFQYEIDVSENSYKMA